jgi:hypothetical protein
MRTVLTARSSLSYHTGLELAGVFAGVVLLTYPLFFEIYRSMVFEVAPRDDYTPYLLYLLGEGGHGLDSPYGYRILSILAALPFYFVLPVVSFSNLPPLDPTYLKATQAFAALSYVSIALTSVVMYCLVRRRLDSSVLLSGFAAALTVLLFHFTATPTLDPTAILIVAILFYLIENRLAFSLLVLISAIVNEKIAIVFSTLFLIRLALDRALWRTFSVQLVSSLASVLLYIALLIIVELPGREHQYSIFNFIPSIVSTLQRTFTLQGLVLNVMPLVVLLALAAPALPRLLRRPYGSAYIHPSNALTPIALFFIALLPDIYYNVGRVVMYSFPLVLPLFVTSIIAIGKPVPDTEIA